MYFAIVVLPEIQFLGYIPKAWSFIGVRRLVDFEIKPCIIFNRCDFFTLCASFLQSKNSIIQNFLEAVFFNN